MAYFLKVEPSFFCAMPIALGTTCNGDSGSAVVSSRNGQWQVDGIVSFGLPVIGCIPLPVIMSGYNHVWLFNNWIKFNMGG
jgi:secreted trypsin-like serine protease